MVVLHRFKNNALTCRIPRHLFPSHWITKVPIVLCLVLQSVPTHVNEVAGYSAIAIKEKTFYRLSLPNCSINTLQRRCNPNLWVSRAIPIGQPLTSLRDIWTKKVIKYTKKSKLTCGNCQIFPLGWQKTATIGVITTKFHNTKPRRVKRWYLSSQTVKHLSLGNSK